MDAYECDGCGACCRTWRVLVTATDAAREPRITVEGREIAEHLWRGHDGGCEMGDGGLREATKAGGIGGGASGPEPEPWRWQLFPLPFHEGCVFLGEDQRCGVYASRPTVCRSFAPGSPRCQEARALQGMGPLAPVGAGERLHRRAALAPE